ncbi:MAG: Wzt carbohydrate-binding domain-containing protein [Candidatus Omnitrophica bacterium]|nr:Wzt carbohydrate-binding domain-containing protein [Candidatus Omnitrophota bacterium]MDD5652591.1 Wzt carbohydrate-binding domain-containing protein [Candidatus Omnitrophota bacterium]
MQNTKIIELSQVGKNYQPSGFWALKDVSLDVVKGEIVGIIGRNGAGKTTLLNIIADVLYPTQGEVKTRGRKLGLFNLGVGFQDELTGRENIFLNGAILGANRTEIEEKLSGVIGFSELGNFIDQPLGTYSQGMRLRLGFSIIANLDFDILIIDEILAVGDLLFQNKCFEKIMDFRRAGKTLVITNQNMELMERICDRIALLEHGRLVYFGEKEEAVRQYRELLAKEGFFIGSTNAAESIFENTKKWADEPQNWGKILGTKEVVIEKVAFKNRFGFNCVSLKSRAPLRIKVDFTALNDIKEPHFGVAIFRNDGVYCYGPNTAFDGQVFPILKKGRGSFTLNYQSVLLAPGDYRVSIAIWDKNETVAFDYHDGCYKFLVKGQADLSNQLLNMPLAGFSKFPSDSGKIHPDLETLRNNWMQKLESPDTGPGSLRVYNSLHEEKNKFHTGELVKLSVFFPEIKKYDPENYIWVGFYRDDRIFCQGAVSKMGHTNKREFIFRSLPLLPGEYRVSFGVWNEREKKFLSLYHALYPLHMVFSKGDHGTVYLEHNWKVRLP